MPPRSASSTRRVGPVRRAAGRRRRDEQGGVDDGVLRNVTRRTPSSRRLDVRRADPSDTSIPSSPTMRARCFATGLVDLLRHESRVVLDDVRAQAELAQRVGRLQAQQAAADDDADGAGIFSRARCASPRISSRSSSVRYTWQPALSWPGTGGTKAYDPVAKTRGVVGDALAKSAGDGPCVAVDRGDGVAPGAIPPGCHRRSRCRSGPATSAPVPT